MYQKIEKISFLLCAKGLMYIGHTKNQYRCATFSTSGKVSSENHCQSSKIGNMIPLLSTFPSKSE